MIAKFRDYQVMLLMYTERERERDREIKLNLTNQLFAMTEEKVACAPTFCG